MQNSGGYRERMTRQEDAEFWCRTTSLGFRAKKITQAVTYYHRQRNDSKGAVEWQVNGHEPDWTAWFPWRTGAHDYQQAVKVLRKYSGNHPAPHLVPFGAQGKSPIASFWQVHDFAYPVVSVIVTCGPSHEKYLLDALDSIQAQSYPDWECIVVNDTGNTWSGDIMGAPWAQVVTTGGNLGASVARNTGFKHARGRYIIWLDADDYWLPWYLELMVAHAEKNDGIIYSNLIIDDGKEKKVYRYDKFDSEQVAKHMGYPGSSILFPRKIVEAVITLQGGWDIQIPGMEDWDFQIAAHSLGFCAYHVPEPLFVYRKYSSTKRDNDYAKIDSILAYMDQKWHKYRKDGEKMGCGCGGTKTVNRIPDSIMSSSGNFKTEGGENIKIDSPTQMVQVEYVGPIAEDFQIRSRVDMGIFYRFGNNQYNKERTVFAEDAAFLMGLMDGEGKSLYRILGAATSEENRNPAEVLGETIVA